MDYLKLVDTEENFEKINSSLIKPNVTLVTETPKVYYNFEPDITVVDVYKIAYSQTQTLYLSKNNIQFKVNINELNKNTYELILHDGDNVTKVKPMKITKDNNVTNGFILTIYDNFALVLSLMDKTFNKDDMFAPDENTHLFTYPGLKRKDNGKYDFVGEIDSFVDSKNNPYITISRSNRTNGLDILVTPDKKSKTFTYKGQTIDYSLYELPKNTMLMAYKL
jgi:hypothetical protein